ncbi:MAG: pyridoxal phosphate-dependent aminotransferase [Candidatus Aminicenantia bacterium]
MREFASEKTKLFGESVIREMTRLSREYNATNLAQGFPDFPAPEFVKNSATEAIRKDINQYSYTWGSTKLRRAISERFLKKYNFSIDPEKEITICCGSTEAMISSLMAVLNPGDEVIIFEPFYENYVPGSILAGAKPVYVKLYEPDWNFEVDELERAFSDKTKAIIVNNPHNPTGKVFRKDELEKIAELCIKNDCIAITDEIYEYIIYDGKEHMLLASIEGMRERTITVSGLSKTFSITGWRIGYAIAYPEISSSIRKVHDFLTVCAPSPLQEACALVLNSNEEYFLKLKEEYQRKRDILIDYLEKAGFGYFKPSGAYYVMTDISNFGFSDDWEFMKFLIKEIGVSGVPGSSFYHDDSGKQKVRFCFSKKDVTLHEAGKKLLRIKEILKS